MEKTRGNCVQAAPEKVLSWCKKEFFYSVNNELLEQPPNGRGKPLSLDVFKMQLDKVLDNLI